MLIPANTALEGDHRHGSVFPHCSALWGMLGIPPGFCLRVDVWSDHHDQVQPTLQLSTTSDRRSTTWTVRAIVDEHS